MNKALQLECICKTFQEFKLSDINFTLKKGHIMGLIGENGAGKTTIINRILNIIKPEQGSIKILNKDNIKYEISLKEKIGVVFDSNYFENDWSIKHIEHLFKIFYKQWNHEKFKYFCMKFNLSKKKKIHELSKGMQMKLMVACALSYDSELLILDEPTSGLDPTSRNELLEILHEYVKDGNKSVLFSTHITSDLDKIADEITFIGNGRVIYTGEKLKLINSFKKITNQCTSLTPELEKYLIGLKIKENTFSALIKTDYVKLFPSISYIDATLDDIIIYTNKEIKR